MRRNISIWVYIYTTLHALFAIGMGIMAYIDPSYQFTGLLQTSSVMHPIGLYANRSIAIALASLVAVVYGIRTRRPYQISAIMLIMLLVDASDLILLWVRGDASLITAAVYAVLFLIPETISLFYLYNKFRPYRRRTDTGGDYPVS